MYAQNQPQAHPRISSNLPQTQHQIQPWIMCRLTPMIAKSAPELFENDQAKDKEIIYAFNYYITFVFR
jgi:hypothetical protein